jgi:murein DD-endopeptidase MepM/ murein hydrolase activator NlpD
MRIIYFAGWLALALLIACDSQQHPDIAVQTAATPRPIRQAAPALTDTRSAAATLAAPSPTSVRSTGQVTATEAPATATAIRAATITPGAPTDSPATPSAEHIYVFPVRSDGKVTYGKTHHDYPATDIFCAVGSEFLAVTDGMVDFVSREDRWDPRINDGATRGGLSVAIVGDDGVRYYGSHLSQVADGIAPGVRVAVGQVLGFTGQSGDAAMTPPHLHFGISHATTPGDWAVRRGEIAPYRYLQAWQRGENLTPALSKQ